MRGCVGACARWCVRALVRARVGACVGACVGGCVRATCAARKGVPPLKGCHSAKCAYISTPPRCASGAATISNQHAMVKASRLVKGSAGGKEHTAAPKVLDQHAVAVARMKVLETRRRCTRATWPVAASVALRNNGRRKGPVADSGP